MSASFAATLTRLNAAAIARLSGSEVITIATVPVAAIFDNGYTPGSAGGMAIAAAGPVLTLATASVPSSPVDKPVTVDAVAYTIAEHMPDGTGMSTLLLDRTL